MIEKITDQNLERYDSRLKEWCDRKFFEKGNYGKYQTTEEAGAVAFYPVPNTPLEGKVKFSFTETPPASGDKSPSNPSTITGVSSLKITRCGKNLCKSTTLSHGDINDITYSVNADGSVTVGGTTATQNTAQHMTVLVLPAGTYTLSGCLAGGSTSTYVLLVYTNPNIGWTRDTGSGVTFTLTQKTTVRPSIYIYQGFNLSSGLLFKPQIESGSTATSFEVANSDDYVIDLDSTYYGGSLDVATGVMTVTHAAVTPDASTVDISSAPAALPLDYADTYGRTITSADGTSLVVGSTGGTVVYKLATPQTVQLTPIQILSLTQANKYTPRLNTVYTDADSIQISYLKSPIRDEYEKTQAILSLGGNS